MKHGKGRRKCEECRETLSLGEAGPLCGPCDEYFAEEAAYFDYLENESMRSEHEDQDPKGRTDRP